jgi:phosphoribosylformylglycinamidine synthase
MNAAILVFPGINRDQDMARALRLVSGRAPKMVWHAETALPPDTDLVVVPGGFSYGDYLRCGESGLLPGVLMRNARLKFLCHDVHLRVERSDMPFTRGYKAGQVIRVPVAHGEGNYTADVDTLARLEGEGRVLFRYCNATGAVDRDGAMNGAANAIAGIVNDRGNVLGMMPHPENHVEEVMGCTDGRGLFAGLVDQLGRAA